MGGWITALLFLIGLLFFGEWVQNRRGQGGGRTSAPTGTELEPLHKFISSETDEESEAALRALGVDDMTGPEFEDFLGDLMEEVGFDVEHTGGPGDLGADLVIRSSALSVAVQAKRYSSSKSVSRRAVSDVLAARKHYGVEDALVVTNRYFTVSAFEFAQDRCLLLGRNTLSVLSSQYYSELNKFGDSVPLRGLSGHLFESLLADLFRERDWRVEELGGSGDYGVDLILRGDERVAVQVKRRTSPVSRRAVADAASGQDYYDCDSAWVVSSAKRFTSGARKLAESTGVRLVGRDRVLGLAKKFDYEPFIPVGRTDRMEGETLVSELKEMARIRRMKVSRRWKFDPNGAASLFGGGKKGQIKFQYADAPPNTWVVVNCPRRGGVTFSPTNDRARSNGNTYAVPVTGSGCIRFTISVSGSSRTVGDVAKDLDNEQFQMSFKTSAPDEEDL